MMMEIHAFSALVGENFASIQLADGEHEGDRQADPGKRKRGSRRSVPLPRVEVSIRTGLHDKEIEQFVRAWEMTESRQETVTRLKRRRHPCNTLDEVNRVAALLWAAGIALKPKSLV